MPQELSEVLWSLKNVNAEGLVTESRFRNLQSCELQYGLDSAVGLRCNI